MEKLNELSQDELMTIEGGGLFGSLLLLVNPEIGIRTYAAVKGFFKGIRDGFPEGYNQHTY